MLTVFRNMKQYGPLLMATTRNALRNRFTGSVLGAVWLLLYPILFLTLYAVVFVYILGVRMPGLGTKDYILMIFSGLIPFLAFSEAFGLGSASILANRSLLRNTLFPIEMVVARDVLVGHVTMGAGLLLIWLIILVNGHLYWSHLAVPVIFFFQILMTLGLVWIVASLTIFFRDLLQAIPIIILLLMMVSPIAYTDTMVPQHLKFILQFNPLAWLMHLYRTCLLQGMVPFMTLSLFGVFCVLTFIIGYRFISRLKSMFSDHV